MGRLPTPRGTRLHRAMWIFLAVCALSLVTSAAVTWFYFDTLSEPGGPSCSAAHPCPTPTWRSATLHTEEAAVALAFATAGVVSLALFVWSSGVPGTARPSRTA
jgi:hypothetical protein